MREHFCSVVALQDSLHTSALQHRLGSILFSQRTTDNAGSGLPH